MPRRGRGSRSTSLQVQPSDSFQSPGQEPASPTYSDSTTRAEVNYADSESTLPGAAAPGAFPPSDVSGASRTTGTDAQKRRGNRLNNGSSQHEYIRNDTPDNDLENNERSIDSDYWRRVLPSENDKVQLSDLFSNSPDSDSGHLGLLDLPGPSRRLSPSEVDPEQWRRVAGSEADEAASIRSLRDHPDRGRWQFESEAEAEMWDTLHGQGRQPSSEVDSDQWGRVRSPDTHVRISPQALQSQWSPPSEPLSHLMKRVNGSRPRQQPSFYNPDPSRAVRPQNCQAVSSPGPSSTQRRQTVGSERLPESPVAGPSSAQQRPSLVNERRATGAPPGAPTGPRRGASASYRHQSQTNVPTRSNDRKVTFDVAAVGRTPAVDPTQGAVATTSGTRRRAASGGNEFSERIPSAANARPPQTSPSANRAARQTAISAIPATTKVVQRTSPENRVTQQPPPASDQSNPQRNPTPEPRKRTRTRTRNRRRKDRVWAAVCSKRRYVITVVGSLLSLVVLLVVLLKGIKP